MSKSWKRTLSVAAGACALALLLAALLLRAWCTHAKAPLEAAASQALGLQLTIGAAPGVQFFPRLALTLQDLQLRKPEREHDASVAVAPFAAAARVTIDVAPLALLRRQLQVRGIRFEHVRLTLSRGRDGKFDFESQSAAGAAAAAQPPALPSAVSFTDVALLYTDRLHDRNVQGQGCAVQLTRLQVAAAPGSGLLRRLSFDAGVSCRQLISGDLTLADVRMTLGDREAVLQTDNLALSAFGGRATGAARADFSGAVPQYWLRLSLQQFQLAQFSASFSRRNIGSGLMDFSTELSMAGTDGAQLIRSSTGDASLHGTDLTLAVGNLDDELAHYQAAQQFRLADLGAFLLAGPIGLAVTTGYDYAKIRSMSGGGSHIETFVSQWHVEHGVAQAADVAMSTRINRIALQGNLDFVSDSLQDVTVAVVDHRGCATMLQRVHGAFSDPHVDALDIVSALVGPGLHLLQKARQALDGGQCPVFYRGSLPPPQ
jgi:AsmA protein